MWRTAGKIRDFSRVALAFFSLLVVIDEATAQRLPLKNYTTTDGLPHNTINNIFSDSRGFLWFCTDEGLSRFDGYSFTNYTTDQGLPHLIVEDFLETRSGEFWIGTKAGLVKLDPKGTPMNRVVNARQAAGSASPMFTVVASDNNTMTVIKLLEGGDGTIWVGTLKGLFRLERSGGTIVLRPVEIGMPSDHPEQRFVSDLMEDRSGSLWVATPSGLYRRWPDGTSARYTKGDGLPDDHFHDLLIDHQGGLWAGTRNGGFFRFTADSTRKPPVIAAKYANWNQSSKWVFQLFETSGHRFWAGTTSGLVEFFPEGDRQGNQFREYTTRNGLLYHEITALGEDAGGNLWLGSYAGAMKLAREGFVTYDEQDGLASVGSIFGDKAGGVCFRAFLLGDERKSVFEGARLDPRRRSENYHQRYGRFDGQNFSWFLPREPRSRNFGWVVEGLTLQTHNGEWWLGTGEGLFRFPPSDDFSRIKDAHPLDVYQTKEGLGKFQQVFRLFEDSRGDVWASTVAGPSGLARWERATGTLHRDLASAPGLPSPATDLALSFGEDSFGNVWIGFSSGVARYRDGSFTFFDIKGPSGPIQDVYSDRSGRLWLASGLKGLVRVDDPSAEHPTFKNYTAAEGLSGNSVGVITEDLQGHLYLSTARGLDRFDPTSGGVKHFTTADGLATGRIVAAYRAANGSLWFGTTKGLSRFIPAADTPRQAPPVLIVNVYVAGVRQNISALGETNIAIQDLRADQNQLEIGFVGLSFAPGEVLQYQYRLGGGSSNWSAPTDQRTVNFANLAPGPYRFEVRAINSDGVTSSRPATIAFTVLRPIWQRWWFLSLAAFAVAGVAFMAYRYRVNRLVDLERVRTRIATDLHDDIGANLTRISLLSELAKQQRGNGNLLTSIAEIARESVSSMNDIVWAISPEHDRLLDLTRRMRQHAEEVFALQDIKLNFHAPAADSGTYLRASIRRDVLLIFKEAVNNAARHSQCTEVAIDFYSDHHVLRLQISDNGKGFEVSAQSNGHGLSSMERRATSLGGALTVNSRPGYGTTVHLNLPLPKASHI